MPPFLRVAYAITNLNDGVYELTHYSGTVKSKSRDYKEGPLHSKKRKVLSS